MYIPDKVKNRPVHFCSRSSFFFFFFFFFFLFLLIICVIILLATSLPPLSPRFTLFPSPLFFLLPPALLFTFKLFLCLRCEHASPLPAATINLTGRRDEQKARNKEQSRIIRDNQHRRKEKKPFFPSISISIPFPFSRISQKKRLSGTTNFT